MQFIPNKPKRPLRDFYPRKYTYGGYFLSIFHTPEHMTRKHTATVFSSYFQLLEVKKPHYHAILGNWWDNFCRETLFSMYICSNDQIKDFFEKSLFDYLLPMKDHLLIGCFNGKCWFESLLCMYSEGDVDDIFSDIFLKRGWVFLRIIDESIITEMKTEILLEYTQKRYET